jgi:small-conductance mechanosensitive channel
MSVAALKSAFEPVQGTPDLSGIDWPQLLQTYGLRLLVALLLLGVGLALAKLLSRALDRILARAKVEATARGFLRNLTYAISVLIVAVVVLAHLGVNTTSLLAVLGATGLAIGLALKDSLSNIASGVMLIALRPFRDGDHVIVNGQEGIVQEVRVFQTKLRTFDERVVTLPNSIITTTPIVNFSSLPNRRLEVPVGVGYDDDLTKAQGILLDIANEHPLILESPEPFVRVTALADSTVNLMLYAYARNSDFGLAQSQILQSVRDRLLGSGLSIPYPQRDLHLYHHNDIPLTGEQVASLISANPQASPMEKQPGDTSAGNG